MSDRAIAIHGYKMSGERRVNLEKKSECPGLVLWYSWGSINWNFSTDLDENFEVGTIFQIYSVGAAAGFRNTVRLYQNSITHIPRPKFGKWLNSLCFYPCVFFGHLELCQKNAASRIIQTIWNWRAIHMLDLLLLIVKCPFNQIKILLW